jgi:hypothetical protein
MITLFELHWSHYCEKIRLTVDYMGLPWARAGDQRVYQAAIQGPSKTRTEC